MDLVATLLDLAGVTAPFKLDGESLLPLIHGDEDGWKDQAFCEYLAHGVRGPMAMLRRGRFKLNYSLGDPVELYDLEADPGELHDLSCDPDYAPIREQLRTDLLSHWNPVDLEREIRQSQVERLLINEATRDEWIPISANDPVERR